MEILVIGGTRFVGRHLATALLARDHDLTFFHRGQTNPDLFPEVDRVLGDRTTDLHRLGDDPWDVVIDTCGYTPAHVETAVEYLSPRADRYVFISSAAVYEPTTEPGIDETAAVQTDVPTSDEVDWWHSEYARNKVACEAIVRDAFDESNALVVRPGMIMGPHDPVNFFTYWVLRLHRGGDVLVPAIRDQPLQFIDARDLGRFTAEAVDRSLAGAFTVDGPADPLTVSTFLETLQEHFGRESTLHWVDQEWLRGRDLGTPWEVFPYWLPGEEAEGYCRMSTRKAVRHGLTVRPVTESAADVLDWYERDRLGTREEWSHGYPPNRGPGPERESALLEESRASPSGEPRG